VNYNDFIRRYLGEKEGPIVELETGKILGRHKGYWFHTVGQRKGLGLSGGPWYVIKKDVDANIVWASKGFDAEAQYGNEFLMQDFHFITENPWLNANSEVDVTFKIRHKPEFTKGKIIQTSAGYRMLSSGKLQGIAPGQFGVVYDSEAKICIGSGEIW
jgi:tRNA-specific 2-thiouridylase